jgi:YfiH family protein
MAALSVLTDPVLAALPGVRHAFFTRQGGVSTGLYDSLNVGLGSKDEPSAVIENRRRAAAHFGADADHLLTGFQIHSDVVFTAHAPWGEARPEGDGVATATPGVVCGALSADCAPVLLADPQARVVCAAHAGWKGAVGGVVESAVAAMVGLGADPARIVAAVGPCIGPQSYEVGPEFLERFAAEAPGSERFFRPAAAPGKFMFDLPGFVLSRLQGAGVLQAAWTGHDTCADETLFFSNRRAVLRGEADYGRLLSAICLDQ